MSVQDGLIALFNGALQGTLVALFTGFVLRLVPRLNAATALRIWTAVLTFCAVLPIANLPFQRAATTAAAPLPTPAGSLVLAPRRSGSAVEPARVAAPSATTHWLWSGPGPARHFALTHAAEILATLAAIAFGRVAIVVGQIVALFGARRSVVFVDVPIADLPRGKRRFRVASSTHERSPCALGFAPALIVIPADLLALPDAQLRAIVRHEWAHVQRFDDVANLIVRFVAALGFCCPGVLIAIRCVDLYREQRCDDFAVSDPADRIGYAHVLVAIAQRARLANTAFPCLTLKRKDLVERLRRLLDPATDHAPDVRQWRAGAIIALLACVTIATAQFGVAVAATDDVRAGSWRAVPAPDSEREVDIHIDENDQGAEIAHPFAGQWSLAPCSATGYLRLRLTYAFKAPGTNEAWDFATCVPADELRGITTDALPATADPGHTDRPTPRSFAIVRDAGTLHASGAFARGRGAGTWTFEPNRFLATHLARRVISSPTVSDQFRLTMSDFRLATLTRLEQAGFSKPTIVELVHMGEVGVTDDYVATVIGLPIHARDVRTIVALRERGLTSADIRTFVHVDDRFSADDIVRLADHGIRPGWIAGVPNRATLSVDDLIQLHDRAR